ncbi:hypothetical protein P171DRAFT_486447 [Karstenula rhodostoma CBS 690.94]|uniref:Uncharacterized protein n=1 Tax=Karstenula rhodostoma CBS 690.94 TaxID=1392251 RepID=A0A9P4PEU0_9PLEO|nr:hypothetical protein P171DRAFT_486447 [Karstenula rhodostoma CBS 690.94]
MSGIEVAGLVLGAIPLVLASMEFYAKGIAASKRCFRYREQFQSLLTELQIENTICKNSLHKLLKDMSEFLADPGGHRWQHRQFDYKLRKRLGTGYDSVFAAIDEVRGIIEDVKLRLKLHPSGIAQFNDDAKFREYYKRLDFSLKKIRL